eukprot:snap_masked-scaffold_14-processed-gene-9.23-mRNA-1 protein AED:1.00 eAED:1.00 QI:0/-1/0/0/-1/1/1/0/118
MIVCLRPLQSFRFAEIKEGYNEILTSKAERFHKLSNRVPRESNQLKQQQNFVCLNRDGPNATEVTCLLSLALKTKNLKIQEAHRNWVMMSKETFLLTQLYAKVFFQNYVFKMKTYLSS